MKRCCLTLPSPQLVPSHSNPAFLDNDLQGYKKALVRFTFLALRCRGMGTQKPPDLRDAGTVHVCLDSLATPKLAQAQ